MPLIKIRTVCSLRVTDKKIFKMDRLRSTCSSLGCFINSFMAHNFYSNVNRIWGILSCVRGWEYQGKALISLAKVLKAE